MIYNHLYGCRFSNYFSSVSRIYLVLMTGGVQQLPKALMADNEQCSQISNIARRWVRFRAFQSASLPLRIEADSWEYLAVRYLILKTTSYR